MDGLATITLSISSCRAEEAADQSSYPLKSENAIPLGDISEYLSLFWPCAKRAAAARTASTATAVATMIKPAIRSKVVRVSIFCSRCPCATDFVTSSDMLCSPSQRKFSEPDQRAVEQIRSRQR